MSNNVFVVILKENENIYSIRNYLNDMYNCCIAKIFQYNYINSKFFEILDYPYDIMIVCASEEESIKFYNNASISLIERCV